MYDVKDVANLLVDLLQKVEPGTFVTNRALRALVTRRLSQGVRLETYFAAIDMLESRNLIERKRGQGGQIALINNADDPAPGVLSDDAPPPYFTEPRLMGYLEKYLRTILWRDLDIPSGEGSEWMVINTSMIGPRKGLWTRPDYTVVSVTRFAVLPLAHLDIYSFELKAENACNVTSIHEALAQMRWTNYGYLVWHVPDGSPREIELTEISRDCNTHGVGLIRIRDPYMCDGWTIEVVAQRRPTPLQNVDSFLASRRLTDQQRALIKSKLLR
jgi:hypothetical protein